MPPTGEMKTARQAEMERKEKPIINNHSRAGSGGEEIGGSRSSRRKEDAETTNSQRQPSNKPQCSRPCTGRERAANNLVACFAGDQGRCTGSVYIECGE